MGRGDGGMSLERDAIRPWAFASVAIAFGVSFGMQEAPAQQAPSPPPCSTPQHRQLDFWVGDWDLEYRNGTGAIVHARNRITRDEYGECVIAEHFRLPGGGAGGGDYIGASHSMFDPQIGRWRQMWVENGGATVTLVGGPVTGQAHSFELLTTEPRGPTPRMMRMIWQDVTPAGLTWRWQAQQADGSWQDVWAIRYRRRGEAAPAASPAAD